MAIYLSSFYPLGCTKKGQLAIDTYPHIPPYVDGSCRREPDFEKLNPAITGLCRPRFTKNLHKGDIVIYTTNKKGIGSKKIVAVLEVIETCSTHEKAATLYTKRKLDVPNNIMTKETKPFKLDMTHQITRCTICGTDEKDLESWDKSYVERSKAQPKVSICKILFIELCNPLEFTEAEMKRIFNRRPGTRNPSFVSEEQWLEIKKLIKHYKNHHVPKILSK